jgi:Mycothiol maleylpyruvate isomerase N-terminal domain
MNDAGVGTRATEAMGLFIDAVEQIPSAAWDQPSNLEGWSIRDLVCRQVAESVPEDELRRPGLFGPAQPVPEDATPTARLMAYFGRPVSRGG